jgi:curved DNA-binding protein CbpA
MSAERSAFAILGLRPGAGRAQVDSAYRRLMKLYHPDRTGGDGIRAAEINRVSGRI